MRQTIATTLMLMLASASFAQEMRVLEVKCGEAVVVDKAGKAWRVKKGDVISDGWKVVGVTDRLVTIEKWTSGRERVRGQMPVKAMIKQNVRP